MEENKKINGRLIVGSIAIVAILIIGIVVFAFSGESKATFKQLKGTPEEIIMTAFSNTNTKSIEEQDTMDGKVGRTQVSKILDEQASEMNFNLVLQGISGVENATILSAYIKDTGLTGKFQVAKDYEKLNGNLQVTQSGIEILGMTVYKDEDEIGVSVPKILDAPYAIKTSSWIEDYKNSALCGLIGEEAISQDEMNQMTELFGGFSEYMTGAMHLNENKEYRIQMEALQAELIKNAKVVENGKETITLTDGNETEWTIYSGTLTGEEVLDFFNKQMELLMSLDFARSYFDIIAKQSGYTVDEMLEEMKVDLEEVNGVTVDVNFLVDDTFFRGVRLGINEQEKRVADISIECLGESYLLDNIEINLEMTDDELVERMEMMFNQNLGEKADIYTQGFSISCFENDVEELSMDYSYEYDTKAKADNLKVKLGMIAEGVNVIDYTATGTKTVTRKEVSTNISNASITSNDGTENGTVDFSLGYGIKVIDPSEIKVEKTGVKYLFEMTEADLLKALQSIKENIQSFTYGLI